MENVGQFVNYKLDEGSSASFAILVIMCNALKKIAADDFRGARDARSRLIDIFYPAIYDT